MICVILNEVKNLKSVSLCIQILRFALNDNIILFKNFFTNQSR